jgi:uncharacterized membrane protein
MIATCRDRQGHNFGTGGTVMAFCGKCGSQVNPGATFCGTCGAPIGSAPAPGAGPAGPPLSSNIGAMLTYIPFAGWIIAIVFLVIEPYKSDRFVRFHAFQSIFLAVFSIILYWVVNLTLGLSLGLLWPLWWLIRLAIFLLWLLMMYKAYNNERYELPVIGPMAAKQSASI